MVSFKHLLQSLKNDSADSSRVRPSDWNAEHEVTTEADGIMLGRMEGAGPGPVQELPLAGTLLSGMVIAYGGATAPTGWLICGGQEVERAVYPGLFAVIGVAFGAGNGVSTFNVPDLLGRVIAGVDTGTPPRLTPASATPVAGSMTPNATSRGATGGHELFTAFTNVSDIEVSGGHPKFGGVWEHCIAGMGVFARLFGNVLVSGSGPTAGPDGTLIVQSGTGATVASDLHTHHVATSFYSAQDGGAVISPNVVPETHATEDSQGRFWGKTMKNTDDSVVARESYPVDMMQPTLLMHYIIKI